MLEAVLAIGQPQLERGWPEVLTPATIVVTQPTVHETVAEVQRSDFDNADGHTFVVNRFAIGPLT
jgi:hypothetical protein